jgi:hypothetical protein
MSKVADVKLKWTPSPSEGVVKQIVQVTIDGIPSMETEVSPETTELMVEVKATESVIFQVVTTDDEGLSVISESYTFRLGNLEAPLPATGLGHTIVAIRDVVDEEEEE